MDSPANYYFLNKAYENLEAEIGGNKSQVRKII